MKLLVIIARAALSIGLLFYLGSLLDWDRIRYIFTILQLEYVWQPFLLLLLCIFLASIRWTVVLRQLQMQQKVLDSWRFYMISTFYGIMLPGIVGGDVVRLGLGVKNNGIEKTGSIAVSVVFERVCGFLALISISAVAASFLPRYLEINKTLTHSIYILVFTAIVCFLSFFLLINKFPEQWIFIVFKNKFINALHKLIVQFRCFSSITLINVLIISIIINFLDIVGNYYLAKAFAMDVSIFVFFLIIPLVYVITALPISLGGLGIREGALTFFLVQVGVAASDAVLYSFLIYLNKVAVAMIGGLVQLFNGKDKAANTS